MDEDTRQPARGRDRRAVLLRLDPAVHDALQRWAADDMMSANAKIEQLLREQMRKAGRMPKDAAPIPKRGRPPKSAAEKGPEA